MSARGRARWACLGLALFLGLTAGPGRSAPPPYQRPAGVAEEREPLVTAGYRALFTCSAHFLMGRPLDDILRVELVDVADPAYPPPVIDLARRLVIARDPSGRIERVAAYRDAMGCTVLPPHWGVGDAPRLPYVPRDAPPDLTRVPFPAGDRTGLPVDGLDPAYGVLAPLLSRAFDGQSYGESPGVVTTAVLVLHRGRLVAERYRPGFGVHAGYRTWSTAKSLTAALVGIAAGQGLIDLAEPVPVPEWGWPGDPRQRITWRHLLWMSSGLVSGGANTNALYFGGQDVVSSATANALEAEPGTRWKYANNDTLLLLRALRHVLADDLRYLRFPYDELFTPLGMHHTWMETDHLGHFVGSSQVYTTARDLARFGLLLAADGVHQGRRLLPEGWVRFLATAAPTRPPADGQWGYGAQFWLLDRMPGVPAGTFTTAGNKGQYVTVVPGRDLVVVRTGVDPEGRRFQQHRLVADVATALAGR